MRRRKRRLGFAGRVVCAVLQRSAAPRRGIEATSASGPTSTVIVVPRFDTRRGGCHHPQGVGPFLAKQW